MKTIEISGVIGWDVYADDIRRQFNEAKNEEIDLRVSSPGGSVWEALGIFNAIREHTKTVTATISDIAASAAAYIVSAADNIKVFDNSVFMIHNPWSFALGDYRDFAKESEFLDDVAAITAKGFVQKTGKSLSKIRDLMDEETWLFGEKIVEEGFADTILPAETEDDTPENVMIAYAQTRVKNCFAQMQKDETKTAEYHQQIMNLIQQPKTIKPVIQEKKTMNLEEFKKDHLDLFNAIVSDATIKERKRVQAHLNFLKISCAKDHAIEAIEKGSVFDEVEMSFYQTESMKARDLEDRSDDNTADDTTPPPPNDDISDDEKKKNLFNEAMKYSTVKAKK